MSENDHPRVIVDDDFLDLRNPKQKPISRRPPSAQSKHNSSSINTQGRTGTKEVLPGLQRLLNTYNQKNANNLGYKKGNTAQNQSIDSRFRRKVEKKSLSSRSESILQEKEKSFNDTQTLRSSEKSAPTTSSVSENRTEFNEDPPTNHCEKPLKSSPKNKKFQPNEDIFLKMISRPVTAESKRKEKKKIKDDEEFNKEINRILDEAEKSTVIEEKDGVNVDVPEIKAPLNFEECTMITSTEAMKNAVEECAYINKNLQKLKWYDPALLTLPTSTHFIPTFKKSWTIPSLPLMKRENMWSKHYNALCTKVDRKTYEYDADDNNSLDSVDQMSSYSTLFRSNYMNLIFCLGCLCGIFLIAGILTASEIQTDLYKTSEPKMGIFEFVFRGISNTIQTIFDGLHAVLTFPSTKFFRPTVEPPKYWGIF